MATQVASSSLPIRIRTKRAAGEIGKVLIHEFSGRRRGTLVFLLHEVWWVFACAGSCLFVRIGVRGGLLHCLCAVCALDVLTFVQLSKLSLLLEKLSVASTIARTHARPWQALSETFASFRLGTGGGRSIHNRRGGYS